MHKHWLKFLAVLLCGLSLLTVVLSAWGIWSFAHLGLYSGDLETVQDQQMANDMKALSQRIASRYAAGFFTEPTDEFLQAYYGWYDREHQIREPEAGMWFYEIYEYSTGQFKESGPGTQETTGAMLYKEFLVQSEYPVIQPGHPEEGLLPDFVDDTPDPLPGTYEFEWVDPATGQEETLLLLDESGPIYKVRISLLPGAYERQVAYLWELLEIAFEHKYLPLIVLPIGLLLLAAALCWLASTAGKKQGREALSPGGLNRLPLDLYWLMAVGGAIGTVYFVNELIHKHFARETSTVIIGGILLMGLGLCLLVTGALFASVAQLRVKGFCWQHSAFRALIRLIRMGFHSLRRVWTGWLKLMPVAWQWILWAAALCGALALAVLASSLWLILAGAVLAMLLLLYMIQTYKILLDGARRMSKGDLETPVDASLLMGSFADFAGHLNGLADVATVAAQKQMRSERLRAELITNVSHDIKTPLTSIINYVDLLKNDPEPEAADQYLEVLSRQSARMKKLIDDLIELSKASTGNMPVELTALDAGEYLMQAVGEFSDKLEKAGLEPVLQIPHEPVMIRCDSRLTWRVLSNLMSNAVKYALPGTRLYVELERRGGKALLSLKNISRDQLNISPEELMERFVRGDTARNTEGSGLGLNIAKSLMELQKGQLALSVDGDLFKATMVFDEMAVNS